MINQKAYFTARGSEQDFAFEYLLFTSIIWYCAEDQVNIKDLNWIFRGTSNVPRSRIKQIRIDRFISLNNRYRLKEANNFQEQSQGLVMTAEMTTWKTWRTLITVCGIRSVTTSPGSGRQRRRWGKSCAVDIIMLEKNNKLSPFRPCLVYSLQ